MMISAHKIVDTHTHICDRSFDPDRIDVLERAAEAGFYFSIPPSVVRSRQKQKLVRHLPLSCLLVETDSPVLGPDPDKRNEPANVAVSLAAIAELKNIREGEVIETVAENTKLLYRNILND